MLNQTGSMFIAGQRKDLGTPNAKLNFAAKTSCTFSSSLLMYVKYLKMKSKIFFEITSIFTVKLSLYSLAIAREAGI